MENQPEPLSKNAQKKLLKQKQKEQEKLKKEQEKLKKQQENKDKDQGNKKKQEEEEIKDPRLYFENRCNVVNKLKEEGGEKFPYPHKYPVNTDIKNLVNKYKEDCLKKDKGTFLSEESDLQVFAGRVITIRLVGKNLLFIDIIADDFKVQVVANQSKYPNKEEFEEFKNKTKRGDIAGITGHPGISKSGEFSVLATNLKLLSPCLHMLPDNYVGLKDLETRYRNRFLDLIVNNKSRNIFRTRSKVIYLLRESLNSRGFLEVETPVLNIIPGGATARPFITNHNELNLEMFMRVAPELYLKMCVIGGLDRVFEIGKVFRNEGIDQTHNPEFTMCEFYRAYADYKDLMNQTEEMLCYIVEKVKGSLKVDITNKEGNKVEIDFTRPWKRISIIEELERVTNVKFPEDIESDEFNNVMDQLCKKNNIDCKNPRTTARLIDKLVGELIEPSLINPTFLIEHPQLMCPLAKYHREKKGLSERFELFINTYEFCNGYTELNDPFVQRNLFMDQMKNKCKGDDEAQPIDEGFIKAMEHGLPPTAGCGIGVDRFVMLLTDNLNIQEVILFPAMKPIDENKDKKEEIKVEKK